MSAKKIAFRCCSMSLKNTNITPKVWSRFQATRKNGDVIKLRIQDYPFDQYRNEIVDYYMEHFIDEEAFNKAAGISKNEEAKTEFRDILYYGYEENHPHVIICCIDDDSNIVNPKILGMSLLNNINAATNDYDLKDYKPKTKEVRDLFEIISVIKDIKISKGYERHYEGRGMSVRPDHRGMGIANEFMRLRKQICIDNNVPMSCAWMTAIGTQKAAEKYKWKTFKEISVEEFEKKTGLLFNSTAPVFKLMYITKEKF